MRFTHSASALEAMRQVEEVGDGSTVRRQGLADVRAIKIRRFTFTGATEH